MNVHRSLGAGLALVVASFAVADKPISLTILHTNDLHAHVEPTPIAGKLYGGYARQATLIRRFRKQDPNSLLLNAGDCFQGTMYFNTYEGLVECAFMNTIGYDAMCLGNHEFDRGPATLATFIKNANFPVLCSNVTPGSEPLLDGVKPFTILTVAGEKFGIVGAVTPDAPNISSPGPNLKFIDLATSVQQSIDTLERSGVDKVILLTHIGYAEDQKLVSTLHGVDLVVGGHSHTPLGTPSLPGWPRSAGPYPTATHDAYGRAVYIVQGWEWGKVLGHFRVSFNAKGEVTELTDAAPVVVDESVAEDPIIQSLMVAFKKPIDAQMNKPVGSVPVDLDRGLGNAMANVVADAMLEATSKYEPVAAFVNAGGVRANIDPGTITYGEALAVAPFGNTLTVVTLKGSELQAVLEEGVPSQDKTGGMLYPSEGFTYRVDFSKPQGEHVSDVRIKGKPLDPAASYACTFNNFTATGGDSHFILKAAPGARIETKINDLDCLIAYFGAHNPLVAPVAPRVLFSPRYF